MLTPRVTETRRLSPHAFAREGKPDIPPDQTIRDWRRTRPRKRKRRFV